MIYMEIQRSIFEFNEFTNFEEDRVKIIVGDLYARRLEFLLSELPNRRGRDSIDVWRD